MQPGARSAAAHERPNLWHRKEKKSDGTKASRTSSGSSGQGLAAAGAAAVRPEAHSHRRLRASRRAAQRSRGRARLGRLQAEQRPRHLALQPAGGSRSRWPRKARKSAPGTHHHHPLRAHTQGVLGGSDVHLHVWLRISLPSALRGVPCRDGNLSSEACARTALVRGVAFLQDCRRSVPLKSPMIQMVQSVHLAKFSGRMYLRSPVTRQQYMLRVNVPQAPEPAVRVFPNSGKMRATNHVMDVVGELQLHPDDVHAVDFEVRAPRERSFFTPCGSVAALLHSSHQTWPHALPVRAAARGGVPLVLQRAGGGPSARAGARRAACGGPGGAAPPRRRQRADAGRDASAGRGDNAAAAAAAGPSGAKAWAAEPRGPASACARPARHADRRHRGTRCGAARPAGPANATTLGCPRPAPWFVCLAACFIRV